MQGGPTNPDITIDSRPGNTLVKGALGARLRRPPAELDAAQQEALPPRRHSLLQQGVALRRRWLLRGCLWACVWLRPTPGPDFRTRLSVGLRVAAPYARSRLPHAPAPGAPRRHLNPPAPSARDLHRTPPSLSPQPGRLGPPHPAARHTGPAAHTAPFCPHNAADSGPSRAWPCHARGGPTDPDAPTDARPENTLVKDRTQPLWSLRPGQVERRTHDYLRCGTTSLFTALDVQSGQVIGQCQPRHRAVEFRKFLDTIETAVPADLDIHLIVDNYATHKTARIRDWLAKRPHFHLHFTPTSASWLHQVERWFALLTEKQLRRGVHRSTRELETAILHYLQVTNENSKPFVWTKTADQILANVARFCRRTLDPGH